MTDIYVMRFTTKLDGYEISRLREAPSFHLPTHDEHYEIWDFDYKPKVSDYGHMHGKRIRIELDEDRFLRYSKPLIQVLCEMVPSLITVITPNWSRMSCVLFETPQIVFDDFNLFSIKENHVFVR